MQVGRQLQAGLANITVSKACVARRAVLSKKFGSLRGAPFTTGQRRTAAAVKNRTTQIAIAKLGRFAPWNLVHVASQKAPLIVTISPNVCASLDIVQTPVAFAHSVLSRF